MLKIRLLIILLFAAAIYSYAEKPVKVIITAGQSNTEGRILNTDLPEYIAAIPDMQYKYCKWSSGGSTQEIPGELNPFRPTIYNKNNPYRWAYDAVTYYWLEQALQEDFYVIKWSLGGTSIDTAAVSTGKYHWSADPAWLSQTSSTATGGRSLLLSLEENIAACIDSTLSKLDGGYEIVALLWHQGESDSRNGTGVRYYDNLKNMLNHVRSFIAVKTGEEKYMQLPFIYGTVSHANKRFSKDVEDAMYWLASEDKDCHGIDMSAGELQNDKLHFTKESGEYLGIQMYNVLVDLGVAGDKAKKVDINKQK